MFWLLIQTSAEEEQERYAQLQADQQQQRLAEKAPPKEEGTKSKVPGMSFIEKMFPVMWSIIGFKMPTSSASLAKTILKKVITMFGIEVMLILWPIISFATLIFGKINLLVIKFPKSTIYEFVASMSIVCITLAIVYILIVAIICTLGGTFLSKWIFNINCHI